MCQVFSPTYQVLAVKTVRFYEERGQGKVKAPSSVLRPIQATDPPLPNPRGGGMEDKEIFHYGYKPESMLCLLIIRRALIWASVCGPACRALIRAWAVGGEIGTSMGETSRFRHRHFAGGPGQKKFSLNCLTPVANFLRTVSMGVFYAVLATGKNIRNISSCWFFKAF